MKRNYESVVCALSLSDQFLQNNLLRQFWNMYLNTLYEWIGAAVGECCDHREIVQRSRKIQGVSKIECYEQVLITTVTENSAQDYNAERLMDIGD